MGIVNRFGTDTLTAYGAAGKIDTIITQAILTLSGALAAFCGQNIGAGKFDRVRNGVRFGLIVDVLLSIITFTAIFFWGANMMQAFTDDPNVIAIGKEYLLVIGGFFVIHGALNIFNGALRGAGDTFFTMLVSVLCLWLIRIPLAHYLSDIMGRSGIWWAIGLSILIGCLITGTYYRLGRWKKHSVVRS